MEENIGHELDHNTEIVQIEITIYKYDTWWRREVGRDRVTQEIMFLSFIM
jgi:hypothetical protein